MPVWQWILLTRCLIFMSIVFVYSPESAPRAYAAIWMILCSHRADLLNKTTQARCCCATKARRSVTSWRSAASARPLAKLLLLLWCMSARASIITALGGLSGEGEAQAQLKDLEGEPDSKQFGLFCPPIFSYEVTGPGLDLLDLSPQKKHMWEEICTISDYIQRHILICQIFYQINFLFYSPSYFHDISDEAPVLFINVALTRKTTDYSKNKLAILGHFAPASRHNFTATSLGFNPSCVCPYVTTASFLCSCRLQWKALNSQRS